MTVVLIVNFIVSAALILGGAMMRKCADNTEDRSIGLRTARAMAGQEQWHFANKKCGRLWLILGSVFLALTLADIMAVIPNVSEPFGKATQLLLLIMQVSGMFIAVALTESQLKEKFGNSST
ncbi:MAG TPA: SdpI family protein [Ruminococcus sp.]|jgi:peptidoglycan/LPS O-acetylase OafA/YrhL|nr:SdpI family protein [Ruminococcus sp.]